MAKSEMPDWLYIASHLTDTVKAILLRTETKVLDDFAPTNYLNIPLASAAKGTAKNRLPKTGSGGVQLKDWPKRTRDKMTMGEIIRPNGVHPEHRDV